MHLAPTAFSATGKIQTYLVQVTGPYMIEAAGAAGGGPGTRGTRVSGMFILRQGDRLKIVAARQGASAVGPRSVPGRGGDSLVWTGTANLPQPVKLMLSARGGAAAIREPEAGGGEVNRATISPPPTHWTRGQGPAALPSRMVAACADGNGYNAGAFRTSSPGMQAGDGYVRITPVVPPAKTVAPPGAAAFCDTRGREAPSETMLPQVTPRPGSWAELLLRRRTSPAR